MFYSVMDPHRSFSNSIVKGYSGEDTKGGAFWENNTMSKFTLKYTIVKIYGFLRNCSSQWKAILGGRK